MAHLVGEKGQVVIEKPLREALGIQPGFVAVQSVVGDHLEIRFFPPEHRRSLRGRLAGFARRSVPAADWTQTREEAWAEAVRQDWPARTSANEERPPACDSRHQPRRPISD